MNVVVCHYHFFKYQTAWICSASRQSMSFVMSVMCQCTSMIPSIAEIANFDNVQDNGMMTTYNKALAVGSLYWREFKVQRVQYFGFGFYYTSIWKDWEHIWIATQHTGVYTTDPFCLIIEGIKLLCHYLEQLVPIMNLTEGGILERRWSKSPLNFPLASGIQKN